MGEGGGGGEVAQVAPQRGAARQSGGGSGGEEGGWGCEGGGRKRGRTGVTRSAEDEVVTGPSQPAWCGWTGSPLRPVTGYWFLRLYASIFYLFFLFLIHLPFTSQP